MPNNEQAHLRHLADLEARLRRFYEGAIQQITLSLSQITLGDKAFQLKDYPFLLARVNQIIQQLGASIYTTVVNGVVTAWNISNQQNNLLVDKRLAGKQPTSEAAAILYDPNHDALQQFLIRKEQGLNLSDRVWNTLENYKTEMETALGVGISEGKSAAEMATDLKAYLQQPDKLFRRVRADDGTLKLSRAARNYHPGQGQYRSSFQNARRLTATETNMAYRKSDSERWKQLPFIKAIKIQVSNNHPTYDECNELSGIYPKDFEFVGWHPLCICFAVAVLISDAEYEKYEDSILGKGKAPDIEYVTDIPEKAKAWITENAERINGWSNQPYWAKNNPKYISELLQGEIKL